MLFKNGSLPNSPYKIMEGTCCKDFKERFQDSKSSNLKLGFYLVGEVFIRWSVQEVG